MTATNKSLFNLIEIFRSSRKKSVTLIVSVTHCEHKQLHDYYCDAEKQHVLPN
ncbi:MAG: hypothetical protein HRU26_04470 [Psychroserpens sp.]|nr:hypothetical protein [Psychroserpens sp.]